MEAVHNMFQMILLELVPKAMPLLAKATATELIIVQVSKTTAELPSVNAYEVRSRMQLVEVEEGIKKCAPNEKVAEEMRTHIRHTREDGQVPVLMMARDGYSKLYGLMAIKEGEMDN